MLFRNILNIPNTFRKFHTLQSHSKHGPGPLKALPHLPLNLFNLLLPFLFLLPSEQSLAATMCAAISCARGRRARRGSARATPHTVHWCEQLSWRHTRGMKAMVSATDFQRVAFSMLILEWMRVLYGPIPHARIFGGK